MLVKHDKKSCLFVYDAAEIASTDLIKCFVCVWVTFVAINVIIFNTYVYICNRIGNNDCSRENHSAYFLWNCLYINFNLN